MKTKLRGDVTDLAEQKETQISKGNNVISPIGLRNYRYQIQGWGLGQKTERLAEHLWGIVRHLKTPFPNSKARWLFSIETKPERPRISSHYIQRRKRWYTKGKWGLREYMHDKQWDPQPSPTLSSQNAGS